MTSPPTASGPTVPAPASPASTERPWLPVAAAGTTLLLWASAFVAIRHLGEDVTPGALSLGRLLVAGVALGALLLTRRERRWPARSRAPQLLACGVLWFGVYNIGLNAAERRIDAGTAALVVQIGPLIVALLAAVFLDEPLHRWLVVGMGLGFAGVVVIAQGSSGHASGDVVGVLLALVAAVAYAIGVLTQKPVLATAGALETTFAATAVGAAVCLPFAGQLLDVLRHGSAGTLLLIAYLGVFPSAIAFTTWAYALARTGAGALSLTTFLVPVIATLLAWGLLDEVPPALAFLGGALAIGGVLLTRRRPRTAPA